MIYDEERNCYTLTKLEENCIKLNIENENLQKKLDIAVKALNEIDPEKVPFKDFHHRGAILWGIARKALKEIDLVGTSMSLAKEEV